ncbi:ABC transporter permease [Kiloniella sp. b19]|uniref:ABC transporter permease n=1 Tax=Kiloniella sp. GXU_MW_B19 TaxID=3141326 RepID=UPI0031D92B8B
MNSPMPPLDQTSEDFPQSPGRRYRILALLLRHIYLMQGSWPRVLEMMYWPTIQIILWGFMTEFFLTHSSWVAQASGVLISAVLLWDMLFRAQLGFSLSFLEELWSRNIGNLAISPIRPWEFLTGLMLMSLLRTIIAIIPATFVAILLYETSIYDLGLPLVAFFANLMLMGWALGMIVCALILRVGLGAESMAWLVIFLIAPVSAIYYPVTVLPEWLQTVAWSLPTAPVFEGMRSVLFEGTFREDLFTRALSLNAVYFSVSALLFLWSWRDSRRRGKLLDIGE